MYKILIINASHRKNGSTSILKTPFAEELGKTSVISELHLADMHLEYFNYENEYSDADDFKIVENSIYETDLIILATPVYWYSMPAKLKTVFDRIHTIYISGNIDKLHNKRLAVLYTYGSCDDKEFTSVFEKTAKYLKMDYIGSLGIKSKFPVGIRDEDYLEKTKAFARIIRRKIWPTNVVQEQHPSTIL